MSKERKWIDFIKWFKILYRVKIINMDIKCMWTVMGSRIIRCTVIIFIVTYRPPPGKWYSIFSRHFMIIYAYIVWSCHYFTFGINLWIVAWDDIESNKPLVFIRCDNTEIQLFFRMKTTDRERPLYIPFRIDSCLRCLHSCLFW